MEERGEGEEEGVRVEGAGVGKEMGEGVGGKGWRGGEAGDALLLRAVEAKDDWGKAYLRQFDPGYHLAAVVWSGRCE